MDQQDINKFKTVTDVIAVAASVSTGHTSFNGQSFSKKWCPHTVPLTAGYFSRGCPHRVSFFSCAANTSTTAIGIRRVVLFTPNIVRILEFGIHSRTQRPTTSVRNFIIVSTERNTIDGRNPLNKNIHMSSTGLQQKKVFWCHVHRCCYPSQRKSFCQPEFSWEWQGVDGKHITSATDQVVHTTAEPLKEIRTVVILKQTSRVVLKFFLC